ncbi:LuxR C-terminal-related transcriptional regulator [Bifidobacterium merycicum]|uniref:LuxR C-terminal-related transcriptional regulator n=2 Tax=Bifidobacterium merycicum TaxID=78345 RepID=UPI0009DF4600
MMRRTYAAALRHHEANMACLPSSMVFPYVGQLESRSANQHTWPRLRGHGISENTVKTYARRAMTKLNARTRSQVIATWLTEKWSRQEN